MPSTLDVIHAMEEVERGASLIGNVLLEVVPHGAVRRNRETEAIVCLATLRLMMRVSRREVGWRVQWYSLQDGRYPTVEFCLASTMATASRVGAWRMFQDHLWNQVAGPAFAGVAFMNRGSRSSRTRHPFLPGSADDKCVVRDGVEHQQLRDVAVLCQELRAWCTVARAYQEGSGSFWAWTEWADRQAQWLGFPQPDASVRPEHVNCRCEPGWDRPILRQPTGYADTITRKRSRKSKEDASPGKALGPPSSKVPFYKPR